MTTALDLSTLETQLIVIQPTPFCNINCRYCYLPNRLSPKRMQVSTLHRIVEAVFALPTLSRQVTVLWHAGEPLAVPLSFYEQAMQLFTQFNTQGRSVLHSIQTNGTCITQQWCDFLKAHQIHIGVSLDGPEHIHNHSRLDRMGRGTFARTMQGMNLLQHNGIEPFIIMVLTSYALGYPDEIWQFLLTHHIKRVAFLAEEVVGAHTKSSLTSDEDMQRYRTFLERILVLKERTDDAPYVMELDVFLEWINYLTHPVRAQHNVPLAILCFDSEGNVSSFSPELLTTTQEPYGNFLFGNVREQSLPEIFAAPKFLRVNEEIQQGVKRCQATCEYFLLCGGGSPAHKLSEHGHFAGTETRYCRLNIQTAADLILHHLEKKYDGAQRP